MYNAIKNNLNVARPPWDLSACAEHAPVLARQCRSLQAERHVSHTLDQKTLSGFTTHLPVPSMQDSKSSSRGVTATNSTLQLNKGREVVALNKRAHFCS